MTEQEKIEEMISTLAASNNPFVDVPVEIMPQVAKALYNAGYRKVDEVRKETAKEFAGKLKAKLFSVFGKTICSDFDTEDITIFIDELLKEYER